MNKQLEMDLRPMKNDLVREIALATTNVYLNGLENGISRRSDLTKDEKEIYYEQIYRRRLDVS